MRKPVSPLEYKCVDCPTNTCDANEYYMVEDDVWVDAGMQPHGGMLCIACLEERLGRQLTGDDFTLCPLNADPAFRKSKRLRERLSA